MRHFNTTIAEDAAKILNSKMGEYLSSEVEDKISPVVLIEREIDVSATGTATNTTAFTLLTTQADKDFYLTNCALHVIKDVTSTSTVTYLQVVIRGVNTTILAIPGISLTVQDQNIAQFWGKRGVKIDRNTAITINNATGTANIVGRAQIQGYYVETTKSSS